MNITVISVAAAEVMSFGNTAGDVGHQGTDKWNVAVGHHLNGGGYISVYYSKLTRMRFGSTGGNLVKQGTSPGNVTVGHQPNGRK